MKLGGADPDFNRRDLWDAIERGDFPEYELCLQTFDEDTANALPFDVLDPTKIIPEELLPLRPVGKLVLDRNPVNFFAETEQVAFCVSHLVPGIDFSDDPLLLGRAFSYLDTQLIRLGGPTFHELPAFELGKVETREIRRRTLGRLRLVDAELEEQVAALLGMEDEADDLVPAREAMDLPRPCAGARSACSSPTAATPCCWRGCAAR